MLRILVFFSGNATAVQYLLRYDQNRGRDYKFVGAFTDKHDALGSTSLFNTGIPVVSCDFRQWCVVRGVDRADLSQRYRYFAEVADLIRGFHPDYIILSGFMLVITNPLLTEYENRILNVHPADLTVLDELGKRKYVGKNTVAVAIAAGEKYIRSTIHVVTAEIDDGPIILLSDPLYIEPGVNPRELQEKIKWRCDGPAYMRALRLLATKGFTIP